MPRGRYFWREVDATWKVTANRTSDDGGADADALPYPIDTFIEMTWICQTCTYININDRAVRCHACDVHRPNGAVAPAIIDLTEICSPRVAAAADEDHSQNARRRRGDVMESNRSRRRRRLISEGGSDFSKGIPCHNDGIDRRTAETNATLASSGNSSARTNSLQEASGDSDITCGMNILVTDISRSKGERDSDDDCIIVDPPPSKKQSLHSDAGDNNYPKHQSKSTEKKESKPKTSIEIHDNPEHKVEREKRDGTKRQHHHTSERSSSNQRLTDIYTHTTPTAEALLERANIILQQSFKHNSLRPLQETAVMNTLQWKSSIVVMATGGGKSLVYQLPALVGGSTNTKVCADTSKVTIVVCPLIALMMDQVNNLLKRGIHTAACLSSSHNAKTRQEILNRLQLDKKKAQKGADKNKTLSKVTPIQLLYCTPELIETDRFRAILTDLYESNRLYLFAIDEAHCASTWGEFRFMWSRLIVSAIDSDAVLSHVHCAGLVALLDRPRLSARFSKVDMGARCISGCSRRSLHRHWCVLRTSFSSASVHFGSSTTSISLIKQLQKSSKISGRHSKWKHRFHA